MIREQIWTNLSLITFISGQLLSWWIEYQIDQRVLALSHTLLKMKQRKRFLKWTERWVPVFLYPVFSFSILGTLKFWRRIPFCCSHLMDVSFLWTMQSLDRALVAVCQSLEDHLNQHHWMDFPNHLACKASEMPQISIECFAISSTLDLRLDPFNRIQFFS